MNQNTSITHKIYKSDLSENLTFSPKLLADDTAFFSVVKNIGASITELNDDLKKVSEWTFRRKMTFNPNPAKQGQKLIFSTKSQMINHPPLLCKQIIVP